MSGEPSWLSVEGIMELNERIVGSTVPPEPYHILNVGGLESAQAKPANYWHYGEEDIVVLAVELCLGLARNHCFVQGNKRTAFAAMDNMLRLNGYRLNLPDTIEAADALVALIKREMTESAFIALIDEHVVDL